MLDVKKIMVPLAFSRLSGELLEYAAGLADALDAELVLVNVINERDVEAVQLITSFGYDVDEEHYLQEIQKQRISELEKMIRKIDFPEERIRVVFRVGRPSRVLLHFAVEEEVDMIVMGIRARSDIMHAFTGSVAERLFHRSPVTIVSFRDHRNAARLRRRLEHG
ncbi:MAG TPA: universal stress protein [Desulfobulbus sp.]|nr:universal stress protein [Desulfobulbus sp.]